MTLFGKIIISLVLGHLVVDFGVFLWELVVWWREAPTKRAPRRV